MLRSRIQYTDEDFIRGLRTGSSEVLEALYRKHFNSVLKLIVNNSGTRAEAEDIYQEAVIVLYEKALEPGFTLTAKLNTFIYAVARRLWLRELRSRGRSPLIRDDEAMDAPGADEAAEVFLEQEADISRMNACLGQLGEPCRTLITDFYVERLSMEQIAEKFGYTNADNAKNQKYKCLQRLKRLFFEKRPEMTVVE